MLRAALKPAGNDADDRRLVGPDTHNAACGIETRKHLLQDATVQGPDTHNAACGIETEEDSLLHRRTVEVPTHTMLRAVLTAKRLCVSFRSHRAVFVCEKRTAILTMRRTDVRIEIQKGTVERSPPLLAEIPPPRFAAQGGDFSFTVEPI